MLRQHAAVAAVCFMILRDLGKTGLRVSEVGLGTEHLGRTHKAKDTIIAAVNKAVENGINYFDLIFNFPEYIDNYGAAFKDHRDNLVIACHLGSAERSGQYFKTRSVGICKKVFAESLARLHTDHIDVANVTYVKNMKEYDEVTRPGSVLDLAFQLKTEGKANHIGISTHDPSVVQAAARSGSFEVITYQVNMANNALPGRNEALTTCAQNGVGVVAMKPFAGGRLLWRNRTVKIASGKRGGGTTITLKVPESMTPIRCLAYTLSQVGVCTAIPGLSSLQELDEILSYQNATAAERDYSEVVRGFKEYKTGECVYCNHCLPCPAGIDIGRVTRLLDVTKALLTADSRAEYGQLKNKASECTKCRACITRCPFDVDVVSNMESAAELFE